MSYLARIHGALADLDARQLRRKIREYRDDVLDFSSNDYLGFSRHPTVLEALRSTRRVGSGGARLLAGAHPEHRELEAALARITAREDALLFSSGYLGALGVLGALEPFAVSAYSDASNHASLIDGLRLTKLPRTIYAHGSLPARRERAMPAVIVSETIFGMDGDAIDVEALVAALGSDDIAVLDEAHAIGVAGPRGGGLAAHCADPRLLVLGTLSKALGALGGFVAGPAIVIEYLRNVARTFIFDTALPPAVAAAARAAVQLAAEGDVLRARLRANGTRLRAGLRDLGFPVADAVGAVVPIIIGEAGEALALAGALELQGIRVPAIRPPTVAPGTSRLRVTLRADHREDDVDALLAALRTVRLPRSKAM